MTIGENIQKYRKLAGYTQKELAEKCNCAVGTIQQYELNKRQPRIETIKLIALALDIPYGCLLDEKYSEYSDNLSRKHEFELMQSPELADARFDEILGNDWAHILLECHLAPYLAITANQDCISLIDNDTFMTYLITSEQVNTIKHLIRSQLKETIKIFSEQNLKRYQ